MPLPKVVAPTFELKLISTPKTIKYRPFLVKEEKALLIAMESGNEKDITATIKDVLKSCVLTRGVKVDDLPSFELEYLFLNIRGKSVGETVELLATCSDDNETKVPLSIKMSDIKLHVPDNHNETIDLGGGISVTMKYPSMQAFLDTNFNVSQTKDDERIDKAFKAVADSVDTIFTADEAWSSSDCTKKELVSFIEQLSSAQFQKIEGFFATMPKLQYKTNVKNPNTDVETEILIEGLSNFFA